jgi:hypothetical protein
MTVATPRYWIRFDYPEGWRVSVDGDCGKQSPNKQGQRSRAFPYVVAACPSRPFFRNSFSGSRGLTNLASLLDT